MNPDELSFDRFEVLLAKMFAARSDDAARQIFHKLKTIWNHYDSTGQSGALNELSDLTAIIYQKVIAQDDEWLSKKTKLHYLVSFFTPDGAAGLAQKMIQQAGSKEKEAENSSETSLLVMALGCAAAVASTSIASKFLESVIEKQEEVVR